MFVLTIPRQLIVLLTAQMRISKFRLRAHRPTYGPIKLEQSRLLFPANVVEGLALTVFRVPVHLIYRRNLVPDPGRRPVQQAVPLPLLDRVKGIPDPGLTSFLLIYNNRTPGMPGTLVRSSLRSSPLNARSIIPFPFRLIVSVSPVSPEFVGSS